MCGICGFIGEVDDSKKVLKQMMDKIAHRGPDDEGMYVDKHAAIGHRRLSIIDRKSTRLNSSHSQQSRMPSSA